MATKKKETKAKKAEQPAPAKKARPAAKAKPAQQPAAGYVSRAVLSGVHLSPRKARLVVDLIRGRRVGTALDLLNFNEKKAAPLLRKLILSAAQNAKERAGVDVDELYVKSAWVDGTGILKRFMPRAHGRATKIRKRYSSITVVLDEV